MKKFYPLDVLAVRRMNMAGRAKIGIEHPYFEVIDRAEERAAAAGHRYVNFAHYDYLGLIGHPEIQAATHEALDRYGTGVLASRLVGGERSFHGIFERNVADFLGQGFSMALVSGYLTNVTLLNHLLGQNDLLIMDEYSHSSILTGASSSRAPKLFFNHNDLGHLEALLKEHRDKHRNCLIAIEGIYSMDGDIPDLPGILELKERYGAWLLIDEAHSFGVLGKTGRGISEHYGTDPKRVDIVIGTLSKAMVSCGGFIAAHEAVIEWLRFTLPGFMYSVGLSPIIAAAANTALGIIRREPERVERLHAVGRHFLERAAAAGLSTGDSIGFGVIPILFETPEQTLAAGAMLKANDIYAPPIVQLGVPKNAPRIRFFLSAKHRFEDIDRTIDLIAANIQKG